MEEIILSEWQVENLAKYFVKMYDKIIDYYKDPKNVEGYKKWHYDRYGTYPEHPLGKDYEEENQ